MNIENFINKINAILDSIGHWGEFWLITANKRGYTIYAESVTFDLVINK